MTSHDPWGTLVGVSVALLAALVVAVVPLDTVTSPAIVVWSLSAAGFLCAMAGALIDVARGAL